MADSAILASQVQATPNGYTLPSGQELILKSVKASYDGTGAAGSFVPVLQVVAPGGAIIGEYPLGQTLAAGASADISWFPGVTGAASTAASGIQFDTDNEGGYLDITTNDTDGDGNGIHLTDASDGGILIEAGAGGITIRDTDEFGSPSIQGPDAQLTLHPQGARVLLQPSGLGSDSDFTVESVTDTFLTIKREGDINVEIVAGKQLITSTAAGTVFEIQEDSTSWFQIDTGKTFKVLDRAGNTLFEVDANGDLHGKTGKALVFNR